VARRYRTHRQRTRTLTAQFSLAEVPTLEVMDTSELDSLVELSTQERARLTGLRDVAKAQQRKALRVNCDLDIKRVDRLHGYITHVR
jgi:hypothetical protein